MLFEINPVAYIRGRESAARGPRVAYSTFLFGSSRHSVISQCNKRKKVFATECNTDINQYCRSVRANNGTKIL
jgi:hypothetical protein